MTVCNASWYTEGEFFGLSIKFCGLFVSVLFLIEFFLFSSNTTKGKLFTIKVVGHQNRAPERLCNCNVILEIFKSSTGQGLEQHALTGPALSRELLGTSRGPFQFRIFYVKPVQVQNASLRINSDVFSLIHFQNQLANPQHFLFLLDKWVKHKVNSLGPQPKRDSMFVL